MPDVSFEGQWTSAMHGVDCVALFDGKQWRLEMLSGLASNIKHIPSPAAQMMPAVSHRQDQTLARALESEGNAEIPENPSKAAEGRDSLTPSMSLPLSITPSVSLPVSTTPSLALEPSNTPSLSRQPSRETSPSVGRQTSQPVLGQHRLASPALPGGSCGAPGPSDAPQPSRGSPSIPPANSMLEVSTSSVSSSDSDEEVVEQPDHTAKQKDAGKAGDVEEVPEFEREFFQDNSSNEDSQNNDSDSSDNQSEEEAKHF